jgi:aminopeptidase N
LAFVNALCTSVLATRHVTLLADLLIPIRPIWACRACRSTPICAGDRDRAGRRRAHRRRRTETPFIDAEAARDNTAAGRRSAAAAAARPQAAVKQAAWSR